MHVCLDIQAAIAQRAGVGRYVRRLAEQLGATAGAHRLTLAYFDFKRQGEPFAVPGAVWRPIRWLPGRAARGLWKTVGWPPFDSLAGRADCFHFPNFILPPLRRGPAVVTIHDVSFLRFPDCAEPANLAFLKARIADTVRRAAAIITDSEFSAQEITSLLNVPSERVFAIHLGIEPEFRDPGPAAVAGLRARLGLDRPYLLAVGTIEPRKNLPLLISAFERLNDLDADLVLAGAPGWRTDGIFERIRSSPRAARIRHLNYVPDADLPALYAGAACLAQPSLYEGFGFPPLEAMACGTPVVASTGGSLPEVLGQAAEIVAAADPEAWAARLRTVLADSALRARLITAGREQAARYRWEDTARRTWAVYERVAT